MLKSCVQSKDLQEQCVMRMDAVEVANQSSHDDELIVFVHDGDGALETGH